MVVAETVTGAPTAAESAASASARRGPDLRAVAEHLHGDVADLEAGGADPARGLGQQRAPEAPAHSRLGGAEVRAQVAQPGGGQQRVAGGVRGDVRVGVPLEALGLVGPGQPGQVERRAVHEAVDVGADADAGDARGSLHPMIMPEQQSRREQRACGPAVGLVARRASWPAVPAWPRATSSRWR